MLEPGDVVGEHVEGGRAVDDEVGHLAADPAAELDSPRVHGAVDQEALDSGLPEERLLVRREGLGTAYGAPLSGPGGVIITPGFIVLLKVSTMADSDKMI